MEAMEIIITQASLKEELIEILNLQNKNHRENLSLEQGSQNGFVTVKHDLALLEKMNEAEPQIIAKANDQVVGYALVMPVSFREMIPVLDPLFEMLKTISFKNKKIDDYTYYVMGQICIDEKYRSMGIFDKLYETHKEKYSKRFDLCVTEVSSRNIRSMKSHLRVGFEVIYTYKDLTDEWNVLVWDWN